MDDVREFGSPDVAIRDTFAEIERAALARQDRVRKVEVGAWTMAALKKWGEQQQEATETRALWGVFNPPEVDAMVPVVREACPVWIDPNLERGVFRVYWIEDNVDRLAPTEVGA